MPDDVQTYLSSDKLYNGEQYNFVNESLYLTNGQDSMTESWTNVKN